MKNNNKKILLFNNEFLKDCYFDFSSPLNVYIEKFHLW